jgi:dolichol-phosphate mannosyltransferase
MLLSVVIPAHNEAANLPQLLHEIRVALASTDAFEVVVVDDGSSDNTQSVLDDVQSGFPQLRIVRHASSCGQSTALMTGVDAATGEIIATLDGDGQNDPADIPGMVDLLLQSFRTEEVRMIAGFRNKRRDSQWRLISSKIANAVRSRILSDATPDSGCGIKVFLKRAFEIMPRFNHMHRFLPALIVRGGGKVISYPVNHRPRVHGQSHYDTLRRLVAGIVDLLGVAWLLRRNRLPVVERMDPVYDERTNLGSIRFDRAAPVLSPIRRAVA